MRDFVTPGKRMTSIIYFRAQSAHEKLRLFTFSTGGLCIVTSQSKQCHSTGRGRRHTVCFHSHLHRNTNVCQKHIHTFPSLLRTLGYFPDSFSLTLKPKVFTLKSIILWKSKGFTTQQSHTQHYCRSQLLNLLDLHYMTLEVKHYTKYKPIYAGMHL